MRDRFLVSPSDLASRLYFHWQIGIERAMAFVNAFSDAVDHRTLGLLLRTRGGGLKYGIVSLDWLSGDFDPRRIYHTATELESGEKLAPAWRCPDDLSQFRFYPVTRYRWTFHLAWRRDRGLFQSGEWIPAVTHDLRLHPTGT